MKALLLLCSLGIGCSDETEPAADEDELLYVWAGPRRPNDGLETPPGNDVLITVDLATKRTIRVVDVGSANNEPHHMARCGDRLFAGGLFSGDVFVFALAVPREPALEATVHGADHGLGVADDVMCMDGGEVLVTMMGNADGGTPGGLLMIEPDLSAHAVIPALPEEAVGFNPHGFDIDPTGATMVTTDLLELASIAVDPPEPVIRSTVRIWDFAELAITDTVEVCAGAMEVRFVPNDPQGRFLVCCMVDGALGLVTPEGGGYRFAPAIDFDGADELVAFPGSIEPSADGRRLWVALTGQGEVRRYDITDPAGPSLEATAIVGKGAHFMELSKDGGRGYVSDYAVQRLEAVTGMSPADDKVWRFDTESMQAERILDLRDEGDDPMLAGRLPLQPHGLAVH